jgi:hypothetical protein
MSALLFHEFDLAGSPGLVESGFARTVETQRADQILVRKCVEPVLLADLRCLGAELEIDRPVVCMIGAWLKNRKRQ